ncbi:MAG TPA: hypothetical protein VH393_04230 [Ktedonobacterales bacterium]|jgi:hypothetical protein
MSQQKRDDLPVINIDEDPWNADWLRRRWDLPYRSVDDLPALREFIASIGMTIEQFKDTVKYRANINEPGMEWLKDL